jgi:hypothetical protein
MKRLLHGLRDRIAAFGSVQDRKSETAIAEELDPSSLVGHPTTLPCCWCVLQEPHLVTDRYSIETALSAIRELASGLPQSDGQYAAIKRASIPALC